MVTNYDANPLDNDKSVLTPVVLPSKNSRLVRSKRSNSEESASLLPTTTAPSTDGQTETKEDPNELDIGNWKVVTERRDDVKVQSINEIQDDYPHFHVTYWMFYPYSQGKTICTLDLGPLGPLPIPLIFGMCLGTKKEFGNHVGDWEHMSLSFKGRKEPDVR